MFAAAVVALALLVGSFEAPTVLEDDVTHDAQMAKMFGDSREEGARGRKGLRANSSIQDFFHAAMRGDFEKGNNVKLATSGLFGSEQRKEAQAAAPQKGEKQQLAEGKLRLKAAHLALAAHAREEHTRKELHAVRRHMLQRHHVESREAAIRALYPTEDKFVARFTGPIPSGDVVVDTFTGGPYVPI
jgi:hypothetical protein